MRRGKACLAFLARLPSLVRKSWKKNKKGCSAGHTVSCITCLRQGTLRGDREALATVTGIVDGTGSVGAAIGQVYFDTARLFRNEKETRRKLGRVNFRKDFWDCYWRQGKKKLTRPVSFSFLKWSYFKGNKTVRTLYPRLVQTRSALNVRSTIIPLFCSQLGLCKIVFLRYAQVLIFEAFFVILP